jgi:immune inhibitor A
MKQKIVSSLIVLVFVFSMLGIAFVPTATSTAELTAYEPIDVGPRLRATDGEINLDSIPETTGPGHHSYYEVGDLAYWLTYDDYYGYVFFDVYQLKAIGTVAEVWLQVDRTWYYHIPEPPANPTNPPIVTDEQIEYILEEFETNIYPTDVGYFGAPDFHDGTYSLLEAWGYVPPGYYYEETGRNVIMISNIRDENYYEDYPYYIAGFYWGLYEDYFDRNIFNIDAYDWEHRLGPEGTEWIPGEYVTRPHLYEAIFAHEYQHLIHADYNPGDDTFMNEACSMFAEILCGYGADWSSINSYLHTPDNSLTIWEDQTDINILADYGAAQLWATYLNDQYGEELIGYFVQAGVPGVEGINAALAHFGYTETFNDVFRDWRIANLLRTDFPGCGKYNYKTIDMQMADPIFTHEISGLPVPPTKGTDFGTTITILGYDTGVSEIGPYGSDYIVLNDWKRTGKILFDGDDIATYGWTMTADGWYSGAANLMNTLLFGEAYVDSADPTLELTTYWDIEDFWDFGFVQVSTDGGETWISLENEYTTYDYDPSAHPDIIANLPGLTSWSGFITPDGWVTMEFDLAAYQGETVLIGFRYMTDWFTTYEGWYISDASVSGEALTLTPVYPEADFKVTAIHAFVMGKCIIYIPVDMWLCDETEWGMTLGLKKPSYTILIVSNLSEKGFVDYEFKANRLFGRLWCNIGY